MGCSWSSCCRQDGTTASPEQSEPLAATPPNEEEVLVKEEEVLVKEEEVNADMGQITSKLFNWNASPAVAEKQQENEQTPSAQASDATPRRPLKDKNKNDSEVSLHEAPQKRLKGDLDYMQFPFLLDKRTVQYIQNNKVMFIMKGLPGSGKSTITKNLENLYKNVVICSADNYFIVDGEYKFDGSKLKEAHAACQEAASDAVLAGTNVVVVDNTHIRNWEMKYYLDLSREHRYVAVVVEPRTPWALDAEELAKRTRHGVDQDLIAKKIDGYQNVLPIYYAWFLNESDSYSVLKLGKEWLNHALGIEPLFEELKKYSGYSSKEELLQYYGKLHFGKALHVTAKFTSRGKLPGSMDYINNPAVKDAQGKVFSINIIGYVITPRTFGARVKLSSEQLTLWDNDDDEIPTELPTPENSSGLDPPQPNEDPNPPAAPNNTSVVAVPQDLANRFTPTTGKGSRAHLTLGVARGIKPVETGFDAVRARMLEEADEKSDGECYQLPGALLKSYGEGMWVLYPENKLIIDGLFSVYT